MTNQLFCSNRRCFFYLQAIINEFCKLQKFVAFDLNNGILFIEVCEYVFFKYT